MSPIVTNICSWGGPAAGGTLGNRSGGTEGSGSGTSDESLVSASLATREGEPRDPEVSRSYVPGAHEIANSRSRF
jgi:hypothetical protein